jgi:hypothetical protein
VKLQVQEILSYAIAGAEYTGAFQSHQWNGRSSFFDFDACVFPAGFVGLVMARLKKVGHQVNLARRPFPAALGPVNPKVDDFAEDPRYDYQMQVVDKVLRHGQIIAQVATGGGKSRIGKLVYRRIGRRTLFLTTRGLLMHQMAKTVRTDLKERVGLLGDDEWSPGPGFNAGMVQTFAARLEVTDQGRELDKMLEKIVKTEDKEIEGLKRRLRKGSDRPEGHRARGR